eukprot:TRINITY_DN3290_c0_g1_i1.p1 TRINITY_DN3290_c0_g1~~TRINITY_DN3290_c0_g1_i1.p1  ORF type:complete len:398 (-),score=113.93 TRINITY_DN3290_c0_g1_i1:36-1229(-)
MADNSAAEEQEKLAQSRRATFEDNIELLSEKRSSTREEALDAIVKELRYHYEPDFLEKRKMTLLDAIKRGIKRGNLKETQLSATALSLIAITLGADSEEIHRDFAPILEEIVQKPGDADVFRAVAATYALLCFVGNMDEAVTLKSAEILHNVFSLQHNENSAAREAVYDKDEAIEAAIKGWSLLLTTVSKRHIFDFVVPNDMQALIDYMRSENVGVRVAAGEAVALLFEAAMDTAEEGDGFDLRTFGNDYGIDVDDLLDLLHTLASDKSKGRAKVDKDKQRVPFKEIRNYIENGETPNESLVFKHQRYEFHGWTQLIQLSAFREALAEGLSPHFERNDLVHQIFDVTLDKDMKKVQLSAVEKRMFMSPSSPMKKASTKSMTKERGRKTTAMDLNLSD